MPSPKEVKGSLQQNGGYWVVRCRIFDPKTHTYKQRSKSTGLPVNGNNKRKAEKAMRDIIAAIEEEVNSDQPEVLADPPFREYIEKFLQKKAVTREEITVHSYRQYARVHIIPALGDIGVREIKPSTLQGYINDKLKTLSVKSVKRHMPVIRGALQEAFLDGIIPLNFSYMPKCVEFPPEEKFEGKTYNLEQVSALLTAAEEKGEPLQSAIILAVCYGLRRSEIAGLRWQDIDFDAGCLHVRNTLVQSGKLAVEKERTKTQKSRRTIDLIDGTVQYFLDLKQAQLDAGLELDKVCRKPDGSEASPYYITRGTMRLMKRCGLEKIRLHDLRHTAATLLAKKATPKQVQQFLGHATIGMTMNVYTHLLDEDRKATSAIMNNLLEESVACSHFCSHSRSDDEKQAS